MLFWEAFRLEVEKMSGKNEMNAKIVEELAKGKRKQLKISRRKKVVVKKICAKELMKDENNFCG
jgi:hypothetical protein